MKRNCGCGSAKSSYGSNMSPYSAASANQMAPYSTAGANQMSPYSTAGANQMSSYGMSSGMVSPAASNSLSPIVCPEKNVYNNVYHTASQPIIHPVNIINQHHTIPCPEHFCTYNVKDVDCGVRSSRKKRRR